MKTPTKRAISLQSAVDKSSQTEVAAMLAISKAAVGKMLRTGRDISIKEIGGEWYYREIKDWRRGES